MEPSALRDAAVVRSRRAGTQVWARFSVVVGLAGVLSAALMGAACGLIFGREPDPHPKATISGAVRGPDNTALAVDRTIRAIDTKTGKRYTTRTNNVGDYTFLLPPGVYRLEFPLRTGETLITQPDPIEVGPADIRADVNLTFAQAQPALVR